MIRGEVKVFFGMGGNFARRFPTGSRRRQALRNLDLTVHVSTKLNRSHLIHGREALILPCLGRTEIDIQAAGPQSITVEDSMSMVHASAGRNKPASEHLRSEPAIVAGMATATLGAVARWSTGTSSSATTTSSATRSRPSSRSSRATMPASACPAASISPRPRASASGRRRPARPISSSSRASARIRAQSDPDVLWLTTVRSHDQYNTTLYSMSDRYRGVFGQRDVVFLNEDEMQKRGLADGDRVDLITVSHDGVERVVRNSAWCATRSRPAAARPTTRRPIRWCRSMPMIPMSFTPSYKGIPIHSGVGVVKTTNLRAEAVKLLEFLVQREAQVAFGEMGEFPANPDAEPIAVVRLWRSIKLDPIDAAGAGTHAADAVALDAKGRVGVTRPLGRSRAVAAALVATLVSAPLLLLPLSFTERAGTWDILAELVPAAVGRSLVLAAGVAVGTLVLGASFAVLVSFYDFPGRRFVEWALVLPLGIPAYILTFVMLGQYDGSTALKRVVSAFGSAQLPEVRSPGGAILLLTLVLYPYVYLLARTAFLAQSAGLMEAARTLGLTHGAAIRRVALPLARPALAAGASLAVMEALADFGTVNLLGYRTLPDAIYRLWYGAFDRRAALQVGAVLLGLVALLVLVERFTRRRSVEQAPGSAWAGTRRRLRSWRAARRLRGAGAFLGRCRGRPGQSVVVVGHRQRARARPYDPHSCATRGNSVLLAPLTAVLTSAIAITVVFAVRLAPTRSRRGRCAPATLGYAVPGSVAAAAVFLIADSVGARFDVALTGTLLVLVAAYCLRFSTLAVQATESRMAALPASFDQAARSLGAGPGRLLGEVHLPLLLPAIANRRVAGLRRSVEGTAGHRTAAALWARHAAVSVFEATKESLYEAAALPALALLVVSIIPAAFLVRAGRATNRR